MQRRKNALIVLLAAIFLIGFTATAEASPMTDQYTEQPPDPSGENPGDPGPITKPKPNEGGVSSSSAGEDYVAPETDYSDQDYDESSTGTSGSGKKESDKQKSKADRDDADKSNGANHQEERDKAKVAVVSTSGGGGDGDGLGWFFPAALIVIAGAIGYAAGKRNRSGLSA